MGLFQVVLLIFVSGKIVITGAKERANIYDAFDKIYPVRSLPPPALSKHFRAFLPSHPRVTRAPIAPITFLGAPQPSRCETQAALAQRHRHERVAHPMRCVCARPCTQVLLRFRKPEPAAGRIGDGRARGR